jgi:hypothetical protein
MVHKVDDMFCFERNCHRNHGLQLRKALGIWRSFQALVSPGSSIPVKGVHQTVVEPSPNDHPISMLFIVDFHGLYHEKISNVAQTIIYKPSPSHHHKYIGGICLAFPVMAGL